MRGLSWPFRSSRGATLIESVVAISLAGIIITAIVGLVVSAVSTSTLSKSRTTATRYAEEGIEVSRKTRDRTNWNNFWTTYVAGTACKSGSPCHVDSTLSLTTGAGVSITPFTRSIIVTNAESAANAQDRAKVTVSVTWIDKGRSQEVELVTYLTTWKK